MEKHDYQLAYYNFLQFCQGNVIVKSSKIIVAKTQISHDFLLKQITQKPCIMSSYGIQDMNIIEAVGEEGRS
jgi:hypothetical protein